MSAGVSWNLVRLLSGGVKNSDGLVDGESGSLGGSKGLSGVLGRFGGTGLGVVKGVPGVSGRVSLSIDSNDSSNTTVVLVSLDLLAALL